MDNEQEITTVKPDKGVIGTKAAGPTPQIQQSLDDIGKLMRSLTNITPNETQVALIEVIRERAKTMGQTIIFNIKPSRERSLALTHLEETTMWAVKAVLMEEPTPQPDGVAPRQGY